LDKNTRLKIQSLPLTEASSPVNQLTNFYVAWCERLNCKFLLKKNLVYVTLFSSKRELTTEFADQLPKKAAFILRKSKKGPTQHLTLCI